MAELFWGVFCPGKGEKCSCVECLRWGGCEDPLAQAVLSHPRYSRVWVPLPAVSVQREGGCVVLSVIQKPQAGFFWLYRQSWLWECLMCSKTCKGCWAQAGTQQGCWCSVISLHFSFEDRISLLHFKIQNYHGKIILVKALSLQDSPIKPLPQEYAPVWRSGFVNLCSWC